MIGKEEVEIVEAELYELNKIKKEKAAFSYQTSW